ncbi:MULTISPECIES: carbohydrate ABC transporter permease [Paenibacillus]|uniref:carbohydrate ABC transporter permease n=1 Tax=Paenibacillus TaxID=44249 RepID=UPI00096F9B7B|nr:MULTISPECIES: sugar ABC transporter permease [Paenibacillus]OMF34594.1 hypothetical protein BK133_12430 [Paenibacillus sp. FSL H8-0548]
MIKKMYYSYWLLLPGLLIFSVFFIYPNLTGFLYAFTNMDESFKYTRFVGFDNFKSLFQEDDQVIAFKNTFIFAIITTVFKIVLGLLLALLANAKLRTTLFFRSMLFFPVLLSTLAVSLVFSALLHPSRGLLNVFLETLHLDMLAQSWLTDPQIVIFSVSFVEIWKWTGLSMILFLAALQTIPQELKESAMVEGVNSWQMFRHITLPLIMPIVNTNVILSVIGGLKVFDIVYALTGGGPGNSSQVINTIVFKNFAAGRNGEATAANVMLFLIVLVIVLLVNKVLNRKVEG